MYGEGGVGRGETRCEEKEEFVGGAQVAGEEVWEDAAGAVKRCSVGFVRCVPGVFERGEGFGGVLCAEDEMFLSIVGFAVYNAIC